MDPKVAEPGEISRLLVNLRDGEAGAFDRLLPLVYDELRKSARQQLRRWRPSQTLDTTALAHEAYLRLADQQGAEWRDRQHFLAVSAVAMRHILVDYARRRLAHKRQAQSQALPLEEARLGAAGNAVEVLALDRALAALAERDQRLCRLVELRFFGGMTVTETAEVLEISERTVKRDWRKARAYLYRHLAGKDSS